jgi:hypothetical protein
VGALVIALIAFSIAAKALIDRVRLQEYGEPIEVTEATYGLNCSGIISLTGSPVAVEQGNATEAASRTCDQKKGKCAFHVTTSQLGDPAPGCGKEFTISWHCGNEAGIHLVQLTPEANGKTALLSCSIKP